MKAAALGRVHPSQDYACCCLFVSQATHKSLKENQNAKGTVVAIINGTGSMGKVGTVCQAQHSLVCLKY